MIVEDWEHRKQIAKERLTICKECPEFVTLTSQCTQCGCIMLAKTMLKSSECPLGKWTKVEEAK